MLWLALIASSLGIGFCIFEVIRLESISILTQISVSWLVGSLLTGWVFKIINWIVPLNCAVVMLILTLEVYLVYMYVLNWRKEVMRIKGAKLQLRPEVHPKFYFLVGVTGIVACFAVMKTYGSLEESVPYSARKVIDSEMAFIASVRCGINRRRVHLHKYRDPIIQGEYYEGPTNPLLFVTGLCSLGASYGSASMIICWMNCISTATILYFSSLHLTRSPLLVCLCYMFNSGWAFYRSAMGRPCAGDLVNNVCARAPVPWYQTLGYGLCVSKDSSYAIPLSLVIILLMQCQNGTKWSRKQLFICLLASLVPSAASSIAIFIIGVCLDTSVRTVLILFICMYVKLWDIKIRSFPIWREYQMEGGFFAPLMFVFNAFGPVVIGVLLPISRFVIYAARRYFSFFATFIFLVFFRVGDTYKDNIVAIMGVCFHMFCVSFIEDLRQLRRLVSDNLTRSVISTLSMILISLYIVGGVMSISRISKNRFGTIGEAGLECGEWIAKNFEIKEVFLCDSDAFIPAAVVAGRQLVCGDIELPWSRGENVRQSFYSITQIEVSDDPVNTARNMSVHYVLGKHGGPLFERFNATNSTKLFTNSAWTVFKIV